MRKTLGILVAAVSMLVSGLMAVPAPAASVTFSIAKVGPQDGGEPSIAAGTGSWLYVDYPGDRGSTFYRSGDGGKHWSIGAFADTFSGDNTVSTDQSGAVYQSNLNNNLQVDVYKSSAQGRSWSKGKTASSANSSNQPFLVDRPWSDAYVPRGKNAQSARVYIAYHDFGPSQVWVNTSTDGGATFGQPVNVITSTEAQAATACNSSPAGVKVARGGPHAGRVYVAWAAADVATSVATGCNYTQLDTFHSIWIAWSDDEGKTWTDKLVADAGFGHDAASFWGDLAVDRKGNPYIAVSQNLEGQWDVYVMASFDGAGTFTRPLKASQGSGTHFFPAIDAGDPGKVVVAYLESRSIVPTLPYGKPAPGGDPGAAWNVVMSQSLDLRSARPHWARTRVTPKPMHMGDVCTLGIFCIPKVSDRSLLDFIDIGIDSRGFAHVAYTDNADRNCICVANQTGGPHL